MHEIYRNSNQIFVDLGQPPDDIDLALDLLLKASRGFDEGSTTRSNSESPNPGQIHQRRLPKTKVSMEQALALSRFADLAWFKRLWVVSFLCLPRGRTDFGVSC